MSRVCCRRGAHDTKGKGELALQVLGSKAFKHVAPVILVINKAGIVPKILKPIKSVISRLSRGNWGAMGDRNYLICNA
jgi:hypothetical protein